MKQFYFVAAASVLAMVAVSSGPAHAQQQHLYNSPGAGFGQGQDGATSHMVYNPPALRQIELAQPSKPAVLGAPNGQNRAGSALAQRPATSISIEKRDAYWAAHDSDRLYRPKSPHVYVAPNDHVNPGRFKRESLTGGYDYLTLGGCNGGLGCTGAP